MNSQRLFAALPYAVLLILAIYFHNIAGHIAYDAQGDNLGPDFWPRLILALTMVICAVQIARVFLFGLGNAKPRNGESLDDKDPDGAPRSAPILAAGLLLIFAYGGLITTIGFALATFLFLVLFMYVGNYRSHLSIWLSSLTGVVLLIFLFQKVVYVSLPRGIPPFDGMTDALLALF